MVVGAKSLNWPHQPPWSHFPLPPALCSTHNTFMYHRPPFLLLPTAAQLRSKERVAGWCCLSLSHLLLVSCPPSSHSRASFEKLNPGAGSHTDGAGILARLLHNCPALGRRSPALPGGRCWERRHLGRWSREGPAAPPAPCDSAERRYASTLNTAALLRGGLPWQETSRLSRENENKPKHTLPPSPPPHTLK